MSWRKLQLNADLGEGCGDDEAIMPYIDMASVACGGHAGDRQSMLSCIQSAKRHGVSIGAHPSYPDRSNFGRVSQLAKLGIEATVAHCREQIMQLLTLCEEQGLTLDYIKPHGALYHDLASNTELCSAFIEHCSGGQLPQCLVGPPASEFEKQAHQYNREYLAEAFADRRYHDDGRLLSRNDSARAPVIEVALEVIEQVDALSHGYVHSYSGKRIEIDAKTLCLHGDTAGAVALAQRIRHYVDGAAVSR